METVTVIIPTYNRADMLAQAVDSALRQTHQPLEVIVVDDGSTDGTAELCSSMPKRVQYIRQSNAGVSAARNLGMRLARGELIALLDSDDLWEVNKLELQLKAMRESGAGWCISACSIVGGDVVAGNGAASDAGEHDDTWKSVFALFENPRRGAAKFFAEWLDYLPIQHMGVLHDCYKGDAYTPLFIGNFALPSSFLAKKTAVEQAGYFDESFRYAEETEYFHRIAAISPVVVVMSPLVQYRLAQAGSLTSSCNSEQLIWNAICSLDRAAGLRAPLSRVEQKNYKIGRRSLTMRLAYTQFTNLLPVPVLKGIKSIKRSYAKRQQSA